MKGRRGEGREAGGGLEGLRRRFPPTKAVLEGVALAILQHLWVSQFEFAIPPNLFSIGMPPDPEQHRDHHGSPRGL
eukprot:4606213-Pyramimonas_sp.AAC.1